MRPDALGWQWQREGLIQRMARRKRSISKRAQLAMLNVGMQARTFDEVVQRYQSEWISEAHCVQVSKSSSVLLALARLRSTQCSKLLTQLAASSWKRTRAELPMSAVRFLSEVQDYWDRQCKPVGPSCASYFLEAHACRGASRPILDTVAERPRRARGLGDLSSSLCL